MSFAPRGFDAVAMNQKSFLGLSHNPFTPPRQGFFAGADRKTHLDHLRHLSQWSRRILVVSGPFGIGKSSLFRELSSSLEPNTKAARLSGTVVTSQREALIGMLQGFGIAAQVNAHSAELAKLISTHVNEQDALGRICMVMVDDAHLLDTQALQQLVSLVSDSALRLLLFTEPATIATLSDIAKDQEIDWFEIRITGFPKAEIHNYLEWRFRQAQYRGRLPFTEEQLAKVVQSSGGNPSVIDSIANRILTDMESGEISKNGTVFPMAHAALAVMLMVLVGLVYVFVQQPDETVILSGQEADRTSEPLQIESQIVQQEQPSSELFAQPENVPAEPFAGEQARQAELADENAVVDDLIAEVPEQEPVAAEPVIEVAASTPASEPAAQPAVTAPVSVIPVEERSVLPTGAFKNARWLLDQDPNRFTLQLLSLSSAERAVAFMNRQSSPSEFAWYQMQRDDKTFYVITYGVFSSQSAAQAAVAGFTGELASIKPWVRPLNLVQDTVRSHSQR